MSDGTNVDADDVDNAVMASATHSVMQGSWCVGNASASGSVRGVARVDVDEREEGTFAEGLQPRALFEGRDGGEVAGEVGAEAAGVSGHDQAETRRRRGVFRPKHSESFTYDVITKIFQLVYSLCQDIQSQLQSVFT